MRGWEEGGGVGWVGGGRGDAVRGREEVGEEEEVGWELSHRPKC